MKKIFIRLFIAMSLLSYCGLVVAQHDNKPNYSDHLTEQDQIFEKNGYDFANLRLRMDLRACANRGNYACASTLGIIYFDEGHYKEAYPFLLQASNKYDDSHDECLGQMFGEGRGVLLNHNKAIYYFKKAAIKGSRSAAYNLSWIYSMKALSYGDSTQKDYSNKKYNGLQSHAWSRVALALGQKNCYDKEGKAKDLALSIREERELLGKLGWLAEANNLSSEICSSVEGCNQ